MKGIPQAHSYAGIPPVGENQNIDFTPYPRKEEVS